jgi:hypothetical protein
MEAIDVKRLIVMGSILMALVLGACVAEPDQNSATTTTRDHTESTVSDQTEAEGQTVEDTVPAEATSDTAVSSQETPTTTLPSDSTTPAVDDDNTESGGEPGVLPEPGDGLDHPKTPNTSMVVPPPMD